MSMLSTVMAEGFAAFGLQVAVKLTVLLALLFLLDGLCRRRHSGWRHLFWRTAVSGMLLLPLASATLPETQVVVPSGSPPLSWTAIGVAVYLLGALVMLAHLAVGLYQTVRLRRCSTPVDERWQAELRGLRRADYLFNLLAVVQGLRRRRTGLAVSMARSSRIESRVRRILGLSGEGAPRTGRVEGAVFVLAMAAGAAVVASGSLRAETEPPAAEDEPAAWGGQRALAVPMSGITVDGRLDDWPAQMPVYPVRGNTNAYGETDISGAGDSLEDVVELRPGDDPRLRRGGRRPGRVRRHRRLGLLDPAHPQVLRRRPHRRAGAGPRRRRPRLGGGAGGGRGRGGPGPLQPRRYGAARTRHLRSAAGTDSQVVAAPGLDQGLQGGDGSRPTWTRTRTSSTPPSPSELRAEVQLLERGPNDGKMLGFLDAAGRFVQITLDDEPDRLTVLSGRKYFDVEGMHGRSTVESGAGLPMEAGAWYEVVCRIDGSTFTASVRGGAAEPPLRGRVPGLPLAGGAAYRRGLPGAENPEAVNRSRAGRSSESSPDGPQRCDDRGPWRHAGSG